MKQVGVNFSQHTTFNYNEHLTELKEKFARLIHSLGGKNEKGTKRYEFEVEFMYALNELELGPIYLRGKLFEKANEITNKLIAHLRNKSEEQAA